METKNIKAFQNDYNLEDGMTLRDYFAAKAMNGMNVLAWKIEDYSTLVERAYLLADAMLKQREL